MSLSRQYNHQENRVCVSFKHVLSYRWRMGQKNWVFLRSALNEWDAWGGKEQPQLERKVLPSEWHVGFPLNAIDYSQGFLTLRKSSMNNSKEKGEWGAKDLRSSKCCPPPKAFNTSKIGGSWNHVDQAQPKCNRVSGNPMIFCSNKQRHPVPRINATIELTRPSQATTFWRTQEGQGENERD